MRTFHLLFVLLLGLAAFAQTTTEKYNSLMNRYEYYNSSGNMIGYKTYDSLMKTWNYYDVQQQTQSQSNYQYVEPVNLKLINQALATKQARYDANVQRVQTAINTLRNNVTNSAYSPAVKTNSITEFNEKCVKALNNQSYDYSSNSQTTEIINWLYNSMNSYVGYFVQQEKIEEQKRKELASQIANEMVYNSGGYTTTNVTEERYNPYKKSYEIVSKDTTLTKVYLDGNRGLLHFYRQNNKTWRYYTWKYKHAADNYHTIIDINDSTLIEIGTLFDWMIFYEQKVGEVYTKRYIYRNLKKNEAIVPTY